MMGWLGVTLAVLGALFYTIHVFYTVALAVSFAKLNRLAAAQQSALMGIAQVVDGNNDRLTRDVSAVALFLTKTFRLDEQKLGSNEPEHSAMPWPSGSLKN